jgi:hypothetical protein
LYILYIRAGLCTCPELRAAPADAPGRAIVACAPALHHAPSTQPQSQPAGTYPSVNS